MGNYSVICAVSGTPLEYFNEVVGVELEANRFPGERNGFVPASWPVFGKYDTVGGVEGEDLSPNCALINRNVWDNAEMYWHVENRHYGNGFIDFEHIMAEANRRYKMECQLQEIDGYNNGEYVWTFADHVWYALERDFTRTDEGLVLRDMLNGQNYNVTGISEEHSYLERSALGEIIVQKLIAGWTYEDAETLYRLVCLWCGQTLTGRQIMPSIIVSIEQSPLYTQRLKIAKFHVSLLQDNKREWKQLNADRKV